MNGKKMKEQPGRCEHHHHHPLAKKAATTSLNMVYGGGSSALSCIFIYSLQRRPFQLLLFRWWAIPASTDFFIVIVVIGAWLVYKESNWIVPTVLIPSMFFVLGSLATCGYILVQFYKLSPEEWKDPLYFVLVRHHKRFCRINSQGRAVDKGGAV